MLVATPGIMGVWAIFLFFALIVGVIGWYRKERGREMVGFAGLLVLSVWIEILAGALP